MRITSRRRRPSRRVGQLTRACPPVQRRGRDDARASSSAQARKCHGYRNTSLQTILHVPVGFEDRHHVVGQIRQEVLELRRGSLTRGHPPHPKPGNDENWFEQFVVPRPLVPRQQRLVRIHVPYNKKIRVTEHRGEDPKVGPTQVVIGREVEGVEHVSHPCSIGTEYDHDKCLPNPLQHIHDLIYRPLAGAELEAHEQAVYDPRQVTHQRNVGEECAHDAKG